MTTNGNGAKRKLSITKGLTIVSIAMFFVVLAFCVWSMADGKNNEEQLARIAIYCAFFIFVEVLAFHGKELFAELTKLIATIKGVATGIIDKVSTNEPPTVD